MQTIKITDFSGYEQVHIYEYLRLQDTRFFRLQIERGDEVSYDAETIAREFFHAIYVGEQLWTICSSFNYLVPAAYSTIPFEFDFKTNKLLQLAEIIYEKVKLTECSQTLAKTYREKICAFIDKYNNDEIEPVCVGLECVFNEIGSNVNSNKGRGNIRI